MASAPMFGRPFSPKVAGSALVTAATGGDPGTAGVAVPIPPGVRQFSVFTVGAGPLWLRTQNGNDIATDAPSDTTCHTYPGGTIVGPFDVFYAPGSENYVVIAKRTGGTVTSYFINWHRS